MLATARVRTTYSADEFWNLTVPEWNAVCDEIRHGEELLDDQMADVKAMIYNAFRGTNSSAKFASEFRLLQRDDQGDDDFFSAFEAMVQ